MGERQFQLKPATRESVPLLVSLVSPSSGGKTFSALRLATGMQKVVGGKIGVIDTESQRALHYSDLFDFEHLAFGAPFSPLDYLAAVEHAQSQGCSIIIVDSMSHEHEGPGGVLEWHEAELDRMAGNDRKRRDKLNFAAWIKPKQARTRLINTILQLGVNAILCFRASEKLKIRPGQQPIDLGWMPIAGREWIYEATLQALMEPNSGGVPNWNPDKPGSKTIVKLPVQFRPLFSEEKPFDESHGEAMAEWARGGAERPAPPPEPPPDTAPTIGDKHRKQLFATAGEAAKRLGVPANAVKDWARGEVKKLGFQSTNDLTVPAWTTLCSRLNAMTLSDLTDEGEGGEEF